MKTYVIEMCEMIKITTSEKVDGEVEKLTDAFNSIRDSLIEKTDTILKKNKKSISNIKNTCASFFDKYDQALKYMQRRFDNINSTFEDYENNFMAPTKMREGRMHAIESKLREQEEARETEFKYLKLLIKKTLTALEQSVFVSGYEPLVPSKSVIYQNPHEVLGMRPPDTALSMVEIGKDKMQDKDTKASIDKGQDKMLPELQNKANITTIGFQKNPDFSIFRDEHSISRSKFARLYSSKRNSLDTASLVAMGDKNLHRRILFLKDTLELNPHLVENKAMLRDQFNEPTQEELYAEKYSPRDRSALNKTVMHTDSNKVETSSIKNTISHFKQNKKFNEMQLRKKTRSVIRKKFDQDEDGEKSINLSPSLHNSSELLRRSKAFASNKHSIGPERMVLPTSLVFGADKSVTAKQHSQRTQENTPSVNFQIQGVGQKKQSE